MWILVEEALVSLIMCFFIFFALEGIFFLLCIVTMTISADYQAPQFTRRLEAIEVLVNQTVVLECDVIGFPEPEITWYQVGSFKLIL